MTILEFIQQYAALTAEQSHEVDSFISRMTAENRADLSASYEGQKAYRKELYIHHIARRIKLVSPKDASTPEINLANAEAVYKTSTKERSPQETRFYDSARQAWSRLLSDAEIKNLDPRAGNKNASRQAGDAPATHDKDSAPAVVAKSPPKEKDTRPIRFETPEKFNAWLVSEVSTLSLYLDANHGNVTPNLEKQIKLFIDKIKKQIQD